MVTILHQMLKDARLLRWLLAAWALLLVILHVVVAVVLRAQAIDRETLSRLSMMETVLVILATAVFVVLAASVVQHDSPTSQTAFWLTRPVSARAMLASKLVFALAVLVALPLLLDVIDFSLAGLAVGWLPPYAIVFQLAWLLPLMAIGAITAGLPQFLLITLFEIVLFIGVYSFAAGLGFRGPSAPLFVLSGGLAAIAAPLLTYVYLTRRLRSSVVLYAVAPVALFAVFAIAPGRPSVEWPWGDLQDYPDARQSGVSVTLDRGSLTLHQAIAQNEIIQAPLTISGVPQDSQIIIFAHGWFDTGSERARVEQFSWMRSMLAASSDPALLMRNVVGDTPLLNAGMLAVPGPLFSVSMPPADFARVKDRQGTLHADLLIGAYEYRREAAVPLKAGAWFDLEGARGRVLAVRPERSFVVVDARRGASSWYDPLATANTVYLMRSPSFGQAVIASARGSSSFGGGASTSNITRTIMPVPLHLSVIWSAIAFNVGNPRATSPRPSDWLTDSQLIVAWRSSAGRWRATVDLPNIRLSEIPRTPRWTGELTR